MPRLTASDFSGSINQSAAHNLIQNNETPMMVNMTQDEIGNVSHRLGSDLIKKNASGGSTQGLGTFRKADGTEEKYVVFSRKLYKHDEDTNTFTQISTGTATTELGSDTAYSGSYTSAEYDWFGQTFAAAATGTISSMQLNVDISTTQVTYTGTGETAVHGDVKELVYIYSDNAGQPGSELWSGTISKQIVNASPNVGVTDTYTIEFAPGIDVVNTTTYHIIVRASSLWSASIPIFGGGTIDYDLESETTWYGDSANPYASGEARKKDDTSSATVPTSGWSARTGVDHAFAVTIVTGTGNAFATASKVSFANYKDKLYMIGSAAGDYLQSTDGALLSTVSGNITGKYLTAGNNRLMVAGDDNKTYYSGVDNETFDTTNQVLKTDNATTGIGTLGDLSPFVAFDNKNMYVFDPNTDTSRTIEDFPCVAHASISVIQGNMFWLNNDGVYYYNTGMAFPVKISTLVENNVTYDALMNQVDKTKYTDAVGESFHNKYYLNLGGLQSGSTVKGQSLDNIWLIYDTRLLSFTIYTYDSGILGVYATTFRNSSGVEELIMASKGDEALFKAEVDSLYTDDDSAGATNAVTGLYRTKYYDLSGKGSMPEALKKLNKIYLKVKATAALTVNQAIDGSTTYNSYKTTGTTTAGSDWHWEKLTPPALSDVSAFGLEITGTGNWTLDTASIDFESKETSGLQPI